MFLIPIMVLSTCERMDKDAKKEVCFLCVFRDAKIVIFNELEAEKEKIFFAFYFVLLLND